MLNTNDLIRRLQEIEEDHGTLEIIGGAISEDDGVRSVSILDSSGIDVEKHEGDKSDIEGIFLT